MSEAMKTERFPIWGTDVIINRSTGGDHIHIHSPRAGGQYNLSGTLSSIFSDEDIYWEHSSYDRIKISTYILKENMDGNIPLLTSE